MRNDKFILKMSDMFSLTITIYVFLKFGFLLFWQLCFYFVLFIYVNPMIYIFVFYNVFILHYNGRLLTCNEIHLLKYYRIHHTIPISNIRLNGSIIDTFCMFNSARFFHNFSFPLLFRHCYIKTWFLSTP